jgi:hypothetical protein
VINTAAPDAIPTATPDALSQDTPRPPPAQLPITHLSPAPAPPVPALPNFRSADEVWAACAPAFAW